VFAECINCKNTADTRKEITALQKELEIMRKRDLELTALFKRLYEDNVLGRILDEHYRTLSDEYTTEQKSLRECIPKAEKYSRTAPQDIWIHYRDIGMLNDVKAEFDIISLDELHKDDFKIVFDDELPQAI